MSLAIVPAGVGRTTKFVPWPELEARKTGAATVEQDCVTVRPEGGSTWAEDTALASFAVEPANAADANGNVAGSESNASATAARSITARVMDRYG
jgi:hypothetical protein